MKRILHNADIAANILKITADTMLLINREGICVDINTHSDLFFLQEDKLLGKNIFELLPAHTREKFVPTLLNVLEQKQSTSKNFKLELSGNTYFFKCIMHPYEDMVLCQYRDITQRSNVKRQLEQVNRNLREIQKAALIGQWAYNTNDDMFYFTGYTGMLSTEKVQIITIDQYESLIVEDDRHAFRKWRKHNQLDPNEESINFRVHINNAICYVKVQAYLSEKCPDGSYNMEGYVQNVTDFQRRRNDINTLTHAINNAKESIFAAKEDGTLIFANRQFMQNHGISDSVNLSDLKIYEIVGDMHTLEDWQKRCTNTKHGDNFRLHSPLKNNKEVLAFEGIMYSVTNDAGELSYWSFTHDISQRIRHEAEIKRLSQIMNATLDNLPASIVIKDAKNDFRYIFRNRESYNRDSCITDAIGKNDYDFYPIEIADTKRAEDTEVANSGKAMYWIKEEKDRNGNTLFLDKKKIRIGGNNLLSPLVINIEWDITELEMMKQELQASKEKAEISNKLKSAFLANMSHEIRTPLNAIVGFSHLIAESDDIEERRSYHNIVEANNERLLHLINEILDLSKIESGIIEFNIEPVNLNKLCSEVYDAHVFRAPQGVQLIYEQSNDTLIIDTDKNRIFQVFSNLIGNAFKFTNEGSISYGFKQENDMIALHVTDTGTGIEPDKIGRVFDRFAKLNTTAQGTGLGLSICKTIIERLGGKISVTSKIGKGTTFTFSLPCQKTNDENADLNADNATNLDNVDNPSASKPTILIAEDTNSNYELLRAFLCEKYHILHAKDGIEVITMYDTIRPDLILMDIKMPNLDGLEASKIIRELSPTIPIIIQSAYTRDVDKEAAEEAGCNDFISKPISEKILKEIIKKWLPQS